MSKPEAEKEYRQLLVRYHKATNYLNNQAIPKSDREKWIPQYEKIVQRLNELVGILGLTKEQIQADI